MRVARILLVMLGALAFCAPAFAVTAQTEDEAYQRQKHLESQLACPQCRSMLNESDSGIARDMKAYIRQGIAEGKTDQEITDGLVAQLGEDVIGVPRKHGFDLLAWVLPLGGIMLGVAGISAGAWYWSRSRSAAEPAPAAPSEPALDPTLELRVDEELRRFDG